MNQNTIKRFLDNAKRYFMQQEDLFGNTLHTEKKTNKKSLTKNLINSSGETWTTAPSLNDLYNEIHECTKCPLGYTRTNFVFGVGNPRAEVMFIGEAPGADEDAQGEPFVGKAGQLLNKILAAVHLDRNEVYICNILKCRPPNNRDPETSEMETCAPYLYKQIELIKPKFIICLGRIAGQWLLQTNQNLTALRGKIHEYNGCSLIVTYHPAALLRNPQWKHPTWEDMKMFKKAYDEMKA